MECFQNEVNLTVSRLSSKVISKSKVMCYVTDVQEMPKKEMWEEGIPAVVQKYFKNIVENM